MSDALVNIGELAATRAALGTGYDRILGYFREDGAKSVAAIEQAIRERSAAALVLPAHTLKGESRQFGAVQLGDMAEEIEMTARRCVEHHEQPDELIGQVSLLRPCFEKTLNALDVTPAPASAPRGPATFGRRSPLGFGRSLV